MVSFQSVDEFNLWCELSPNDLMAVLRFQIPKFGIITWINIIFLAFFKLKNGINDNHNLI